MPRTELIDGVKLVYSDLCQDFVADGRSVEVQIFRMEEEATWTPEVVDEDGGSTVWEDTFPTDQAAWDAFMRTVDDEGIGVFQEDRKPTVH